MTSAFSCGDTPARTHNEIRSEEQGTAWIFHHAVLLGSPDSRTRRGAAIFTWAMLKESSDCARSLDNEFSFRLTIPCNYVATPIRQKRPCDMCGAPRLLSV